MKPNLKPIDEQVIIITGATSGIGLVTARMAARQGARLVLAARNEGVLQELTDEISARGGEAVYTVADVGREEDVRRIAETALDRFGGFDTWFNNAAVSIYGRLTEIPLEEQRRLFETNYWGMVYGARVAVEHLRERGGALVTMGSVLSDRAIPDQGPYCASKHAIKGFIDALRMEVEKDGHPISVTLIKPSAIDTPYKNHAKNYLPNAPMNPPPVYAPDVVAETVLHCAQHPTRDVVVGAGGKAVEVLGAWAPRLTDKVMELTMDRLQQMNEPAGDRERHNLYESISEGKERGEYPFYVAESSLYTKAVLHPIKAALLTLGTGAAVALLWRSRDGG